MDLFNRNNGSKINEKMYEENGYVISVETHKIYHVPKIQNGGVYIFPSGTAGITETAIIEMRHSRPRRIVVSGSFKRFIVELLNFENLMEIDLQEGVEEVKCYFNNKNAVDIKLPTSIKRIGANNYPVVQDLVLPNGVVEIEKMFASHDTNLKSVNIPGSIKVLPHGAFNQCKNLQSVILNEGVETSMRDAFRGTNNLHTLYLPSTYNGTVDLPMEGRPGASVRENSRYDSKRFYEEQNEILNIKIKRGNKNFEFNIRRGDPIAIVIKQNMISFRCVNQQIINVNCEQLEQGIYDIKNGDVKIRNSQSFQGQSETKDNNQTQGSQTTTQNGSQEQEVVDKLDIIFQNAYRDNITKRDDFKGLTSTSKMQIKKAMRILFFQMSRQFGTPKTDYETFDYLYSRVLKDIELGIKDTNSMKDSQDMSQNNSQHQENDNLEKFVKELEEKIFECHNNRDYETAAKYQQQLAIISLIQTVDINSQEEFIERKIAELEAAEDYKTRAYWLSVRAIINFEKKKGM